VVARAAIVGHIFAPIHAERYQAASKPAPNNNKTACKQPRQGTGLVIDSRDDILMAVGADYIHRVRAISYDPLHDGG